MFLRINFSYQLPSVWYLELNGNVLQKLVVKCVSTVQLKDHVTRVNMLDHLKSILKLRFSEIFFHLGLQKISDFSFFYYLFNDRKQVLNHFKSELILKV